MVGPDSGVIGQRIEMRSLIVSAVAALTLLASAANTQDSPTDHATFGFNYFCDTSRQDTEGWIGGFIRFNTPDPGRATRIYIGNGTPFGDGDPNGWIKTWDRVKGRTKGYLTFRATTDRMGWSVYLVHQVTDHDLYEEITVELLDRQIEPCGSAFPVVTMEFHMAGGSA